MSKNCPDCHTLFTDEGETVHDFCRKCQLKKITEEQEREKEEIKKIKNTYPQKEEK